MSSNEELKTLVELNDKRVDNIQLQVDRLRKMIYDLEERIEELES